MSKHYAVNNQEHERHYSSSDVNDRAFREVYLPDFEPSIGAGASSLTRPARSSCPGLTTPTSRPSSGLVSPARSPATPSLTSFVLSSTVHRHCAGQEHGRDGRARGGAVGCTSSCRTRPRRHATHSRRSSAPSSRGGNVCDGHLRAPQARPRLLDRQEAGLGPAPRASRCTSARRQPTST